MSVPLAASKGSVEASPGVPLCEVCGATGAPPDTIVAGAGLGHTV